MVQNTVVEGTTSACAENTSGSAHTRHSPGNYLRVRGEYTSLLDSTGIFGELPPRARRIHGALWRPRHDHGTTSACAENTHIRAGHIPKNRNYLRVRGEYSAYTYTERFRWELPPRARRILSETNMPNPQIGTTSACAENTTDGGVSGVFAGNYLRVRGEYIQTELTLGIDGELPPRARRIRCHNPMVSVQHGTTSACAENTLNELGLL